ncbi:MAG: hypothetical protein U0230_22905 [Polyangiales bacterium]
MTITQFGRAPSRPMRVLLAAAALVSLGGIGCADFATDAYFFVDVFYVLPVLLATWGFGRSGGTVAAVATTVAWALPRLAAWPHLSAAVWAWNLLMRWGLMEVMAVLLGRARTESFALREALDRAIHLPELVPICAWCGKLRNSSDEWQSIEDFLASETDVSMTHGICGPCSHKLLADTHRRAQDR